PETVAELLRALGDELRFILLVSRVEVHQGETLSATAKASQNQKCERCWHYTEDVGSVAEHPTLCKRCADNLSGQDEQRKFS
ncbi:MAG: hypothetical protein IJR44_05210, partial [Neisseriaceae bacterium]|nr:hypothetical protein [Neisseriaceae bacterium]